MHWNKHPSCRVVKVLPARGLFCEVQSFIHGVEGICLRGGPVWQQCETWYEQHIKVCRHSMYLCMSRLSTDNECYLLLLHPQTGTAYLDNCANQQPPRSFEMLAGTSQPPGLRQWRTVYGIGPYELQTFTISETTSHASLMLQDTKHSHLQR